MTNEIRIFIIGAINNLVNFCREKQTEPLWTNGPTGKEYINGLVRIDESGKNRGSFVPGITNIYKTIEFLQGQDWYEVIPDNAREGCRYFQSELNTSTPAYIGVTSLGECRRMKLAVVKREGLHGPELIQHNGGRLRKTNIITFIVKDGMMSTWHPGHPMLPAHCG